MIKVTLEPKAYLRGDFGHEGLGAFTLEETVPSESTVMELLHKLSGLCDVSFHYRFMSCMAKPVRRVVASGATIPN